MIEGNDKTRNNITIRIPGLREVYLELWGQSPITLSQSSDGAVIIEEMDSRLRKIQDLCNVRLPELNDGDGKSIVGYYQCLALRCIRSLCIHMVRKNFYEAENDANELLQSLQVAQRKLERLYL